MLQGGEGAFNHKIANVLVKGRGIYNATGFKEVVFSLYMLVARK
jgi:hypothetical protein